MQYPIKFESLSGMSVLCCSDHQSLLPSFSYLSLIACSLPCYCATFWISPTLRVSTIIDLSPSFGRFGKAGSVNGGLGAISCSLASDVTFWMRWLKRYLKKMSSQQKTRDSVPHSIPVQGSKWKFLLLLLSIAFPHLVAWNDCSCFLNSHPTILCIVLFIK